MTDSYIPEGYHTVTPYLVVEDVPGLVSFLKKTFDVKEREIMTAPDGRVIHAEVQLGDSLIMMGEPGEGSKLMPALLYLYVEDVDQIYHKALAAGGTSVNEPEDQFYGDRTAAVSDEYGNQWWLATHKEDIPPDEMEKRARELYD